MSTAIASDIEELAVVEFTHPLEGFLGGTIGTVVSARPEHDLYRSRSWTPRAAWSALCLDTAMTSASAPVLLGGFRPKGLSACFSRQYVLAPSSAASRGRGSGSSPAAHGRLSTSPRMEFALDRP